jgi:hypothetical protein
MRSAREIFKSLIGTWEISREGSKIKTAEGKATFIKVEERCIKYREELKVKLIGSDTVHHTHREYFYIYEEDTDQIRVAFDSMELFYTMKVAGESVTSCDEHLCINDTYKATYKFLSDTHFSVSYEVKGPKKDYVLKTKFVKVLGSVKEISNKQKEVVDSSKQSNQEELPQWNIILNQQNGNKCLRS